MIRLSSRQRNSAPRDLLARMVGRPSRHAPSGPRPAAFELPPCPTAGIVCPCSKVTVDDLQMVWDKGFQHLELVKRASLCGTGTCQGGVCMPHLRAFVTAKSGQPAAPFTGRPASRQLTISEAAADMHLDPFRRTALHDEHVALGARMDRFGGWWRPWNYGNFLDEYWAVREGVSLGDVSTLGKMIVTGPDVVEALERIYPTTIHDIRPGRSRYVLLLNERGHLIDDGMVCREATDDGSDRFVLTFTSGGASFAEAWIRDWIETWDLDVHILDRTLALGAINVTGPLAAELLRRVGLDEPPRFLQHVHTDVAGIPCHVLRLSFTGEASFELHHPRTHSVELWQALMAAGRDLGVRPHGLQALFALRLEKGHVIVGMDTEMDSTPRRINMDWAVKLDKADFIGRTALLRTADLDDHRRLFGLTMQGPAPIEGAPIWVGGEIVGHVTSSFHSPGLGQHGDARLAEAHTVRRHRDHRRPRGPGHRDPRSTTRRVHVRAPELLQRAARRRQRRRRSTRSSCPTAPRCCASPRRCDRRRCRHADPRRSVRDHRARVRVRALASDAAKSSTTSPITSNGRFPLPASWVKA